MVQVWDGGLRPACGKRTPFLALTRDLSYGAPLLHENHAIPGGPEARPAPTYSRPSRLESL